MNGGFRCASAGAEQVRVASMKRFVFAAALSGLAGAALFSTAAQAQSYGRPNMGGGFVEFLFGGGQAVQPRTRAQPAYPGEPVQSDRAPGYYQPGMYYNQGGTPPLVYRGQQQYGAVDPSGMSRSFDPRYAKQVVQYSGNEKSGTIIVDTPQRYLYLVQDNGTAIRYGIGVGRPGFTWAGVKSVTRKAEWPDWVPPKEMLARRPDLPHFMAGGPDNPLGARALYLGSSLYRIHGSNEPWTIGQAVSSGCIRMRNEDVTDLYERVRVGTKVVVI
jgi:lipoprotein-anchoring transpeptidase ErfK/SrfK